MSNSIAPGSSADVNVRVTALTTNSNVPVTYKTIILKKNLVNGVNTLTQEMMSATNTKYVIKYDYVLDDDITVPADCVLEFDGGSIVNASGNTYSITGNNTGIKAGLIKIFNTDVTITGNWKHDGWRVEWFGAKGDYNIETGIGSDDSSAFNKAVNVAETTNIRKVLIVSDYYIANTIYINKGAISIEGINNYMTGGINPWNFGEPRYGIHTDCAQVIVLNTTADNSYLNIKGISFVNQYYKTERYDSVCFTHNSDFTGPFGDIIFEYCYFQGFDKVFYVPKTTELEYKLGWVYFKYCGMHINNYVAYLDDEIRSNGFSITYCRAAANGQLFRGTVERTNFVLDDINLESPKRYAIPAKDYAPDEHSVVLPAYYVIDLKLTRDCTAIFNNLYFENLSKPLAKVTVLDGADFPLHNNYPPRLYVKDCMTNGYYVGDWSISGKYYTMNVIECAGDNSLHVITDWRDIHIYGTAPIIYDSFAPIDNGLGYVTNQPYWYVFLNKNLTIKAVRLSNQSIPNNVNCTQYLKGKTGYEQKFEIFPVNIEHIPSLGKQAMTDFTGARAANGSPFLTYEIDTQNGVPDFIRHTCIVYSQYGEIFYGWNINAFNSEDTSIASVVEYNKSFKVPAEEYLLVTFVINIKNIKAQYSDNIKKITSSVNCFNGAILKYAKRTIEKIGVDVVDWFNESDHVTNLFTFPNNNIIRAYNGLMLNIGNKILSKDSYNGSETVLTCTTSGQVMTRNDSDFNFTAEGDVITITDNIHYVGEGVEFTSNNEDYKVIRVIRTDTTGIPKFKVNKPITSGIGSIKKAVVE